METFAALDKKLEENKIVSEIKDPEIKPMTFTDSIDAEQEVTELIALPDNECQAIRERLSLLTLSNDAVWQREKQRHARGGEIHAPWFIKTAYYSLCYLLDVLFNNR